MSIENLYNKWICGDSLQWMLDIHRNSIPCILTDVPYDFDVETKRRVHGIFQYLCSGIIIVFSPPENQWILPADQYGFWIKPTSTKNTSKSYSRFVEMIFFYGKHVWNNERHWSQYTNVFTDLVDDAHLHPYRKPPSLIERLIKNHTNPGDVILDPFAGSGVVHDVGTRLGRNVISIEIDEKYNRPDIHIGW